MLGRLASRPNLIMLRPIEKSQQIILSPTPCKNAVNRTNITVVLVGELRVVVHADGVPISEQYLADGLLNLRRSLFSRNLHTLRSRTFSLRHAGPVCQEKQQSATPRCLIQMVR